MYIPRGWGLWLRTLVLLLLSAAPVMAETYLDVTRSVTTQPASTVERIPFTVKRDGPVHYYLSIDMKQGQAQARFLDPAGKEITCQQAGQCTIMGPPLGTGDLARGTYTLEVTTKGAVGTWQVRVYEPSLWQLPPSGSWHVWPTLATGPLMILVALASVWYWRKRSGAAWRWFWVGAAVWTVAVVVKLAVAIPLNNVVLSGLKNALPHWAYLAVGMTYGGLMTGVTEILFTLIAALIWRQLAADSTRGVAIGVGAGAFEAVLIGLAAFVAAIVTGQGSSSLALVISPPLERAIAILCHTASRTLVLLSVARRRWPLFVGGFVLLSGIDALATLFWLTDAVKTVSPLWMELLLVPFGLISIPITVWCVRHWPSAAVPQAFPGQTGLADAEQPGSAAQTGSLP